MRAVGQSQSLYMTRSPAQGDFEEWDVWVLSIKLWVSWGKDVFRL